MPAVALPPWVFPNLQDDDGNPLAGGTISFFVAGESTPLAAYTDATGSTAIAGNVLTLDASGRGVFWLQVGLAYKLVLANADETWSRTVDSVLVPSGGLAYEHSCYLPDAWSDDTPVMVHNYPRDVAFSADFAGSIATVLTYPASEIECAIEDQDANSLGTLTIPATSGELTFETTNPLGFSLDAGDQMRIIPPESGLGATTGLSITMAGSVA